jgi:hypothetical protein
MAIIMPKIILVGEERLRSCHQTCVLRVSFVSLAARKRDIQPGRSGRKRELKAV